MDHARRRAPRPQPSSALPARVGGRQRRPDGRQRGTIGGEQRDVGAEIRGETLQRGLLRGRGRVGGRQHVLGEHARDLEGVAAAVTQMAPEGARHQGEGHEADQNCQIDAEVETAHQSCCRANT